MSTCLSGCCRSSKTVAMSWYAGGGVTVGYQWPLSRHWNVEASLGVGYDYIKYDKFECGRCGNRLEDGHAHYVGPTKAAISFLYVF